jgi:AcrR family transcriptional regulator
VDDIARLAGVAKGTIYLHWKTREQLFISMIAREKLRAGIQIQQEMANDPEGVTLHGLMKYSVLASMRNPLFKALVTRDTEMLGELAEGHYHGIDIEQQVATFYRFLIDMREQGLIRSDHSVEEQTHMVLSIMMGFIMIDPYIPDEFKLPIEKRAELLGETIQRTFELRGPNQEEKQTNTLGFERVLQSMQDFLQKES